MDVECAIKAMTDMIVPLKTREEVSVISEMKRVPDVVTITDLLDHHRLVLFVTGTAVFVQEIELQTGLSDMIGADRDLLTVEIDDIEALAHEHAQGMMAMNTPSPTVPQEMSQTYRF